MPSTTSTETTFAATRLRSSGGSRDRALDSLMGAGVTLAEAQTMVDDIDLKLGFDGRSLPEDVAPAVRRKVVEHREAKKAATPAPMVPAQPRFESPASASDTSVADTPVVDASDTAPAADTSARPRFELQSEPALEKLADEVVVPEKVELTQDEKRKLKALANRRARTTSSQKRLADWLVREGMSEQEAGVTAANAWRTVEVDRKRQAAQQRGDQTMAILEIVGGIALLIAGLAAGWFVGLFIVPIIDGFRRLGSA